MLYYLVDCLRTYPIKPFLTPNWLRLQDGPVSIQEKFEYIMYGRLCDIIDDGLSRSPHEVYVNYVPHVILLYLY